MKQVTQLKDLSIVSCNGYYEKDTRSRITVEKGAFMNNKRLLSDKLNTNLNKRIVSALFEALLFMAQRSG